MRPLRSRLLATALGAGYACVFPASVYSSAHASESSATDAAASAEATFNSDGDDAGAITERTNTVLQLAVILNGRATGQIAEFEIHSGKLFARRDELQSLGLQFAAPAQSAQEDELVSLFGLNGLSTRIDQPTQTLYVNADNEWLVPTTLGRGLANDSYAAESGTGAVLNYDLIVTSTGGHQFASGLFDARLFSPFGVLSSGLLVNAHFSSPKDDGYHSRAIRLDSSYVYSDPRTMRRYRLGDFISGALPWTRPVRLGGVQVNSDFSMRPDLITFPTPSIGGTAAVPSTVDVLVNGSQVISGAVPPGPFEVPQVPVVIGGGAITTTVTDALGRQIVTELPFYASGALLAPKLQTYSAEIGFVRRNWGILSNDYGSAAGALTYRRGISPFVTLEAHAEATRRLQMAALGGVFNVANFAVANVALAASNFRGRPGGQLSAGIQRLTPKYSLGGSLVLAQRDFGDIAAANGDPVSTLQLNLNASLFLRRLGSIGVAYTEVKRKAHVVEARDLQGISSTQPIQPEHSRILTASYSRQFGRIALYATLFRDFGEEKQTNVLVGMTVPLGRRMSASVSAQRSSGRYSGQVEMNQTAIVPGEWGYRLFASGDGLGDGHVSDHEFGQVTYKASWGQVFAGVDRVGGLTTVQGEIRGAVAVAGGGLFLSNRIDDSFAIVDTGAPGIRVRQENRDVGKTNSSGRLLVPDLLSFRQNQLSIEPLDAPIDADVPAVRKAVRPQDRSGVIVKLPVRISNAALLRLVDEQGKPLTVGSTAVLNSTAAAVPVGYDGEAYVMDLAGNNKVAIEQPDGSRCTVEFTYKAAAHTIPTLGPLVCHRVAE